MTDWKTSIVIMFFLAVSFEFGQLRGKYELRNHTVVRYGSPFYLDHPFFGKCADITVANITMSSTVVIQACATDADN